MLIINKRVEKRIKEITYEWLFKLLPIIIILLGSFVFSNTIKAQEHIDIGLFESETENRIDVYLKPNFFVDGALTFTSINYTIRWSEELDVTFGPVAPYYIFPVAPVVEHEGYYYQTIIKENIPVGADIQPGEERLISYFTYTGGDCATFEIINNDWTNGQNSDYYIAIMGSEKTGEIYEPMVSFGSLGGYVTGGGEINLGENTGQLTLTDRQGNVLTWQRRLDGGTWNDISGTSGVQIYSEIPTAIGTWEYRAEVQEGACSSDFSEAATVIVNATETDWTGAESADWHTSGNWSAGIPDNSLSANISDATAPQPVISGSTLAECDDLNIASGNTLTIASDGELTVNGTINNSSGTDGLLINSTAVSSGSLIHSASNVQATYNQELSGLQWHDVTPVVSDALGALYMGYYVRQWDEPSGSWSDWLTDPGMVLEMMRGYQVWVDDAASDNVVYDGSLITGSQSYSLTRDGTGEYAGFNLVGNPYVASIDWNSTALTKTNIDNTFWVWNGTAGNYATYNGSAGTNGGQPEIPPSQAFFVLVTDGFTQGTFGVDNAAMMHSGDAILKEKSAKVYGKIHFHVSGQNYSDENILHFENGYSDSYDSDKDAYKLAGSDQAPQMYTKTNVGEDLAIDYRAIPGEDSEIAVYFEKGEDTQYTLEMMDAENLVNAPVFLEDLKKDTLINILEEVTYTFNSTENDDFHRFNLVFVNNPVSTEDVGNNDAKVYVVDNKVIVEIPDSNMLPSQLLISDIQGKTIKSETIQEKRSEHKIHSSSGVYIVTLISENYMENKKVIINK